MSRVFNFNAGPATLPVEVLQEVQENLLDWHGCGMSVLEMSHRAEPFATLAREAEADLRTLLSIPEDYYVLFLQGGATAQWAAAPMNLLGPHESIDYVLTGTWSSRAAEEGAKYARAHVVAKPEDGFTCIPERSTWQLDPHAAYLHYTPNETIHGVEYHWIPDIISVPLVADFSSCFLSRPVDVTRFGMLYAGAQKNAGPAGMTVVIVRKDLLKVAPARALPRILDYRQQGEKDSMLNTPPCFSWYVSGQIFKWLLQRGGLPAVEAVNARKSAKLYAYLDGEPFYATPVAKRDRSRMNVVFRLPDEALNKAFLEGAKAAGLAGLKGHRSIGGMRASLYNALPEEAVTQLIQYLREFARTRG
ncbi:MAG TPA: 3-phosphoserine/phosphohydroxythreonine transaminase [Nevskiaceae bacterium]|nr:3-phosphoserine/phosphohydroxythreonine transaminase [Nevskiaceae bacterium]